jgi:hypothetical protein
MPSSIVETYKSKVNKGSLTEETKLKLFAYPFRTSKSSLMVTEKLYK